mgnify:CR=1 FL=1
MSHDPISTKSFTSSSLLATPLLACILALCSLTNAFAAGWDVQTHNGKKYVSATNVKTFYGFTQMKKSGNVVELRNKKVLMKITANSQTCYLNKVKFIFSYPVISRGGKTLVSLMDLTKLIDPILRPNYIPNAKGFRTVIIDPGHGGKDAGAVNSLGTEAGYNLKVARIVRDQLKTRGFNVIMTRDSNRYLTLQQRVNLANKYANSIFISIHFNAGGRNKARGLETFTLSPVGVAHYGRGVKSSDYKTRNGNFQDSANIALATAIHGRALERTRTAGVPDRGIKRARYSVLTSIKHPAVLIEGGFMSNPTEARLIHTAAYQKAIGTSISEGIIRYRNALNAR